MPDVYAMSYNTLNYSGMVFNPGNTRTPFSTLIGARQKTTNHVEFAMGQEFTTGGGSQPEISESASLTAPYASRVTRSQGTNVTQIFHEALGVSYGKMSNMGTLSGLNVANQQANPMNELDFQVAAKMAKIGQDIEYTFLRGTYNKATDDTEVNKTRGLVTAITTNVIDADGAALGLWDVAEAMKLIDDNNAPVAGTVLLVDAVTKFQLNADAQQNGLTIVDAGRTINGINISTLVTPLGEIGILVCQKLPAGTAVVANVPYIAPVHQPTPEKGNFFLEELARVGAGKKYQIFGQVGLDYGAEWIHSKITGINTEFVKPKYSKSVYIAGGTMGTVSVDAILESATLDKTTVAPLDTNKVAVASINYNIVPGTDPSLTYLWQVRAKTGTTWTDLTGSYTGYNTSELTIKAADAEKHYRCKITASGSASGTVYTNECDVAASA